MIPPVPSFPYIDTNLLQTYVNTINQLIMKVSMLEVEVQMLKDESIKHQGLASTDEQRRIRIK
jgi:hypothetical protein